MAGGGRPRCRFSAWLALLCIGCSLESFLVLAGDDGSICRSLDDLDTILLPWAIAAQEFIKDNEPPRRFRQVVELFAGQAEISMAADQVHHLHTVAFDNKYHANGINNIIKRQGFTRAARLIMECLPGASVWAAPVCGPWVFICRKGTQRTKADAHGDLGNPRVRRANVMVMHVVILLLIAWLRNLHLWIEQPVSSLMNYFSPFGEFLRSCVKHNVVTYLGAPDFGADTAKPIQVWSSSREVEKLKRNKPKLSKRLVHNADDGSVHGNKSLLKDSSAYPKGFGLAVAHVFAGLARLCGRDVMFEDQLGAVCSDRLLAKRGRKRAR